MILKMVKNNNSGFSLVEILVAFTIIASTMVGIFSLIIQNIQVQKVNKDFLVASMLAQEGLELVRSIRDENWLTSGARTWDGIDDTDLTFSIDYNFNFNINGDPNVVSDSGARLYLDANRFYTHVPTAPNGATQFYRLITITPSGNDTDGDGSDDYVSVSSSIHWIINGATKNYTAETLLYDWR